jgi:lipopolysaccharide transport system ATP-binding protein
VGDAEFQKKCLAKMDDVGHSGRTVLFVSHNMQAVTRLCTRCILLHQGRVKLDGDSTQVANTYMNSGVATSAFREWPEKTLAPGNTVCRFRAVRVRSGNRDIVDLIKISEEVGIEMEYEVLKGSYRFLPHFAVRNQDGIVLFVAVDLDPVWRGRPRPPGRYVSTGWIPANLLVEGIVYVQVVLMTLDPEVVHTVVDEAVAFRITDDLEASNTARGDYGRPLPGLMRPLLEWTTAVVTPEGKAPQLAAQNNS